MSTTTPGAIRDTLVAVLRGLTPSTHSSKKFRFHPRIADSSDFREWADDNQASCFRRYDFRFLTNTGPIMSDGSTQQREAEFEIVVAYPHQYSIYGADNHAELYDVLQSDLSQIAANIGMHGAGSWPTSATPLGPEQIDVEEDENVTFGVLTFSCIYCQSWS